MIMGIMYVMTKHQTKFCVASVVIGTRKINGNRTTRKGLKGDLFYCQQLKGVIA
jgi:hypothetical protein